MTLTYSTVRYGDIDVCWVPELDGGGMSFGQDYLPVVAHLFGRVGRVFELCAGPGFIGFAMLAHGLCDSLALIDVNPAAVEAARETVRRNGLADKVSVYLSDGLADVPADERCDLVVSNPPHFATPIGDESIALLTDDLDWRLHRAFFADVRRFLNPGGSVLLQENSEGADPAVFLPMIEAGGLEYVRSYWYAPTGNATVYYLLAKAALPGLCVDDGDAAPVTVELTDPAATGPELSRHTAHALRLRNGTGRTVTVWFTDTDGGEPLGRVAREFLDRTLAPGAELTLPRMLLAPADYLVTEDGGAVLARLHVPE